MKSGDGATGVSSTLGAAEGPFAGGAGERVAVAETVPLDDATDPMDGDGVIVGRPAGDAATTAAVAFPLAPMVVHAPLADEATEFAYIRNAFDQSKQASNTYSITLLVVSAYARRGPAVAVDSLTAAFFRLSSSSRISLKGFFVAGFWLFVQTATGGAEGGVGDDIVADEVDADAEGMAGPVASLIDVFAPT